MELIRGRHNLRPEHRGCVATIGNFDGVHLGHQSILSLLRKKSAELGLPSLVMTFEPHPRDFFMRGHTPVRLSRLRDKVLALADYGVDRVLILPFNHVFADISADDFVREVLVEGIGVGSLIVGDDFRFGKGRQGDINHLHAAGARFGFEVLRLPTYESDGARVSSTRIRETLKHGDTRAAAELLGRPYSVSGRVVRGDQRGRVLGFPTANLHWHGRCCAASGAMQLPLAGVFTVRVIGLGDEPLNGVANVGVRPTVDGTKQSLEVHLLDFEDDIYGRYVEIQFLDRLRDEKRFDGVEALRVQIEQDVAEARERFANAGRPSGVTAA
ncbi:MAG: bifunctional riboflavin kinase/FAD synthetase, partial [Gammaproteobacteria bacterium]|nr:bifunctional riboflavin kinase/FAD synthetase [Gammaproteobacteria bacterium]